MDHIITFVGGGIVGACIGAVLKSWLDGKAAELAMKRDVLRRFAGNRYVMTGTGPGVQPNGEPFVALNEAFIAFAKEEKVLDALKEMHPASGQRAGLVDSIVTLTKRMADATELPFSAKLNDWFIDNPFSPPHRAGSGSGVVAGVPPLKDTE